MDKDQIETLRRRHEGLLPLPYLDEHNFSESNWAEIRRLKVAGHDVFVSKFDDGTYEIIDGGQGT